MSIVVNEKFSLICFPNINIDSRFPDFLELPHGFIATRSLPGELEEHWEEWLGSHTAKDMREGDLYIGCKSLSRNPEILDQENQNLQRSTRALYWSLLISGWTRAHEAPINFTGAMQKSGLNVRRVSTMNQPKFIPGTPLAPWIGQDRLIQAAEYAKSLEQIYVTQDFKRFKRVINAFQLATEARLADTRLHQFIRCIEGFVLPRIGSTKRDFQHRTKLFLGHNHTELVGELYEIRNKAEHMHDVFDLFTELAPHEKWERLFKRTFQAEFIAKHCMRRLLSDEKLWPHFLNDESLNKFWELDQKQQQDIWGNQIDIESEMKNFYMREIEHADYT